MRVKIPSSLKKKIKDIAKKENISEYEVIENLVEECLEDLDYYKSIFSESEEKSKDDEK